MVVSFSWERAEVVSGALTGLCLSCLLSDCSGARWSLLCVENSAVNRLLCISYPDLEDQRIVWLLCAPELPLAVPLVSVHSRKNWAQIVTCLFVRYFLCWVGGGLLSLFLQKFYLLEIPECPLSFFLHFLLWLPVTHTWHQEQPQGVLEQVSQILRVEEQETKRSWIPDNFRVQSPQPWTT